MDVLARAMRRAADFVVGMPVLLKGGEASEVSLVELAEQLNEQDLTMMLIGRDGARAIMTCDGPMVSALIEMSTIGHVTTANSARAADDPYRCGVDHSVFGPSVGRGERR